MQRPKTNDESTSYSSQIDHGLLAALVGKFDGNLGATGATILLLSRANRLAGLNAFKPLRRSSPASEVDDFCFNPEVKSGCPSTQYQQHSMKLKQSKNKPQQHNACPHKRTSE